MSEEIEQPGNKEAREIPLESLDVKGEKTVGELLLTAREKSGLHLEAVSLETKIPRKSLEYLETDNFEALPAKVYVRGFLRTYAAMLGLDAGYILGKYEVQTGQDHKSRGDHWEIEETLVEEKLEPPRILKRYVIPLILLVVLVAVSWIVIRNFGGSGRESPDEIKTELDEGSAAPAAGGSAPSEDSPGQNDGGGGHEDEQSAATPPDASRTGDREADAAQQPASPPPMELTIRANESDTTWFDLVIYTEIESRPDSVTRDFILYPGQREILRATDSFLFRTIGNAGGFTMDRDGVRLPSLGERGRVRKNIRITREGVFRE